MIMVYTSAMMPKVPQVLVCLVVAFGLFACEGKMKETESNGSGDSVTSGSDYASEIDGAGSAGKTFSNRRFRDVTVQRVGENDFRIKGEGQIFEANFGWIVEDGHHELKKGFEMTDAGAPAWGKFNFTIEVEKQRPNSALTLVLYETSAKDGSRQHELPMPLK